jgi:hypothetical protein
MIAGNGLESADPIVDLARGWDLAKGKELPGG